MRAITTLLSFGFRPFFLLAGLYAVASVGVWIVWYWLAGNGAAVPGTVGPLTPSAWHGHEMVYGYGMAVIAGFFLTAVPNWTGTEPVRGPLLGTLVLTWCAGRIAMWSGSLIAPPIFTAVDVAFIPFLGVVVFRGLGQGGSRRNLVFLPILLFFLIGNVLVHLDALGVLPGFAARGNWLGLNATVLLIAIIGGRVVPAFTTNALRRDGETDLPVSRPSVNAIGILSAAAVVVADALAAGDLVVGLCAFVAAVSNGLRLAGWRGWKTLGEPIVWVIHLGFLWLVIGFALKATALLTGRIAETEAAHAMAIGAIGTMTMGVMSRAALGHTGRALSVRPAIAVAYVLVSAAAVIRVGGPLLAPASMPTTIVTAGVAWIAAFSIFTGVYWKILTGPRVGREF